MSQISTESGLFVNADPKPPGRSRDPMLMRRLHLGVHECALCGGVYGCALHHVRRRSQGGDDSEENLIWLCDGPGTNDCHGRLHRGDTQIKHALGQYLRDRDSSASSMT